MGFDDADIALNSFLDQMLVIREVAVISSSETEHSSTNKGPFVSDNCKVSISSYDKNYL